MLLKMSSKGLLLGDRCVCWCAIRGYYMDLVTSFSLEDLLSFASVALLALFWASFDAYKILYTGIGRCFYLIFMEMR